MQNADQGTAPPLDGRALRIGIVQARFNKTVTDVLSRSCMWELLELGVKRDRIFECNVPGALEIPLALQWMARSGQFDALVAVGCVIRGETYHFELVANESGAGITRVALDSGVPIANAILTTENLQQAEARMQDKGSDAARVAVEMALLKKALQ
ncbi:MAG: 6,7-dimethyl-8-ribityllumazine synthase [Burkholderiaceae bacterium]|jgi:6,7-dimethyl-8-ribityllumazine synthase|nr:6,7-dimethyl-8-ribityllumazine synthase [Burkholderiaceae bacterium]